MKHFLRLIPYFFAFLLLLPNFAAAAPAFPRLAKPPIGERWFSISKDKEQTGYNRLEISEAAGGYEIIVESGAKMSVLGFSRDASSWERYLVNPDLSLRSFEVDEVIDGKPVKLKGEVTAAGVRVSVTAAGKTKEKILKAKGAVYPPCGSQHLSAHAGRGAGEELQDQNAGYRSGEGNRCKDIGHRRRSSRWRRGNGPYAE